MQVCLQSARKLALNREERLHHRHEGVLGVCLEKDIVRPRYPNKRGRPARTYHGLDIRMRDSVKLVKVQLELWANVDIGTFVLGAVAVFWRRKHWQTLRVGRTDTF